MDELIKEKEKKERCILLLVDIGDDKIDGKISELSSLLDTAGGIVDCVVTQRLDAVDNSTYLGSGKLLEARSLIVNNELDLCITNDELSPSQQRNMETILGIPVIDRTTLILDIFALNARTNEGKLQVELAQLKYRLPRLGGKGTSMSRLGGGIGTRGPGESQKESDRRHIQSRIQAIQSRLENMKRQRKLTHDRRQKNGAMTVAIVGYTNAGKSTLLNYLTNAGVLAENKLFATLDPTSRSLKLPDGQTVILVDTVGFIANLPTQLIEAFKSTLEEVIYADVILNVCDASDGEVFDHIKVTEDLIKSLGCENIPMITVFNKCDLYPKLSFFTLGKNNVRISAKTGENVDKLLDDICTILQENKVKLTVLLPYSEGQLASRVRNECSVLNEEYLDDGIKMTCIVDRGFEKLIKNYIYFDGKKS